MHRLRVQRRIVIRGSRALIFIFIEHLRVVVRDIEICVRKGDWVIPETQVHLYEAFMQFLREITVALDVYFVNKNSPDLHKGVILASLDFIQRHETWIDTLKPGDLGSGASKIFHSSLLRFAKGMVKAYRIWRIDLQK